MTRNIYRASQYVSAHVWLAALVLSDNTAQTVVCYVMVLVVAFLLVAGGAKNPDPEKREAE